MTRLVDIIVGLSAMAGILTFLGVRTAVRRTLRTLGRRPDPPSNEHWDEHNERRAQ